MRSMFGVRTMGWPYAPRQAFRSSEAINSTLGFGCAARRKGAVAAAAPERRRFLRVRGIEGGSISRLHTLAWGPARRCDHWCDTFITIISRLRLSMPYR